MIGILFSFACKLLTKEFILIDAKGIPFLLIQPRPVIFILESCIFPMDDLSWKGGGSFPPNSYKPSQYL